MSVKTWIEEFYPVSAKDLVNRGNPSDLDLVNHSLKKWEGARSGNLERHKVELDCAKLSDDGEIGDVFFFGSETCSLCWKAGVGSYPCNLEKI